MSPPRRWDGWKPQLLLHRENVAAPTNGVAPKFFSELGIRACSKSKRPNGGASALMFVSIKVIPVQISDRESALNRR
jgi:hypothetical protein